jgi:hypothetical protein
MNPQAISTPYIAIGAIAVGFIVRLLKDDTKFPITIPAQARPYAALALGIVDGVANRLAGGMPWQNALEYGMFASCASIAGHDVFVEGMRRGREIILPGLMLPPPRRASRSYSEIKVGSEDETKP